MNVLSHDIIHIVQQQPSFDIKKIMSECLGDRLEHSISVDMMYHNISINFAIQLHIYKSICILLAQ